MKRDHRFPLFYNWVEIIKSIPGENHQVLDTACGRGMISQVLLFKGHRVSACDLENYFMGDRNKIDFRKLDLNYPMPYPDDHFDYVINCQALMYLNGISHFLKEARRVLKNGGHLILSFPNIHNLNSRIFFLRRGELSTYPVKDDRRYWQIIYMPILAEFLNAANFRVLKIKGSVPILRYKIRILNMILGRFLFEKGKNIIKTANSLIIDTQVNK